MPGEGVVIAATIGGVLGGGRAAAGEGLFVAALGAGGVLAAVSHSTMMKREVGARVVILCAALEDVTKAIVVGTVGATICLNHLLDLETFQEEKEAEEEVLNVFWVNGDN